MAIDLNDAEYEALAAVDGTWDKSHLATSIKDRLLDLNLIERRVFPTGPLWRTGKGDWLVRAAIRRG